MREKNNLKTKRKLRSPCNWLNSDVDIDAANDIQKRDTQMRDITGNLENSDILDDFESPFDQGRVD